MEDRGLAHRPQSQSQHYADLSAAKGPGGLIGLYLPRVVKNANQYTFIIGEAVSRSQKDKSSRKPQDQTVREFRTRKCVRNKPKS